MHRDAKFTIKGLTDERLTERKKRKKKEIKNKKKRRKGFLSSENSKFA